MPWHESIIEAELAKTKVLVNATSIGLLADESPVPGEILPPDLLVLDLIYAGRGSCATPRRRAARRSDGGTMLLHQGAAAFTLWTGQPAPLDEMQAALDDARARGLTSAEGEPAGEEPAADGRRGRRPPGPSRGRLTRAGDDRGAVPVHHRGREPRPHAGRRGRGRARRASP